MPSKQYGFGGFFTVIEIKLRISGKESDAKFLNRIGEDLEKFRRIHTDAQREFGGYVVIFDKEGEIEREVFALRRRGDFRIVYSYPNHRDRNRDS